MPAIPGREATGGPINGLKGIIGSTPLNTKIIWLRWWIDSKLIKLDLLGPAQFTAVAQFA